MPKGSPLDNLPPHSIPAEQCVLASMMLNPDFAMSTTMALQPEDFYLPEHSYMFRGMRWLVRKGRPLDPVQLREALLQNKGPGGDSYLDLIGGTAYLAEVLNTVPSAANGPHYLQIVKKEKIRRDGIALSNRLMQAMYGREDDDEPGELLNKFAADIVTIGAADAGNRVRHVSEFAEELLANVESGASPRMETGILALDDVIGGLMVGGLNIAAGRPAMGKSQFGKQIVRNVASRGVYAGVVTVEEQGRKIVTNFAAGLSGIKNERIAYRRFGPPETKKSTLEEWDLFLRAITRIQEMPIWISDEPTKLHEVERAIHTMIVREKCKFILVDYLQLIEAPGDSRQTMINDISRGLKRMFKKFDVPGLVLAQLNRSTENRDGHRPRMSDLRESGSIEQDGDLIMLLHRQDYYRAERAEVDQFDGIMDVIVAKNKDGATGDIKLEFDGDTQTIRDLSPKF